MTPRQFALLWFVVLLAPLAVVFGVMWVIGEAAIEKMGDWVDAIDRWANV